MTKVEQPKDGGCKRKERPRGPKSVVFSAALSTDGELRGKGCVTADMAIDIGAGDRGRSARVLSGEVARVVLFARALARSADISREWEMSKVQMQG